MCILCVIQKWSRRVATMLPWLVIPLIGLWALSQLLPPAFRFEITSPRLACVFVLLVTLFWYEVLMPQLSAWRVRRKALLMERKRLEAFEMQKLKKTATRRCRNCLTPYRDQNPGGGRYMCSYCGHMSKRPVLDMPVPPGLGFSNSGIFKNLVGRSGKMLNGNGWSENRWMPVQQWPENGTWTNGSTYLRKNRVNTFGGDEIRLAEKSYSSGFVFACRLLTSFFLSIRWLWRKIFRLSSSIDESSSGVDQRGLLARHDENGGHYQESRGEKARRKAEEKRQARLEKELLEEEERKQREEVARLVEERRKLRDEKIEAEKCSKSSAAARERGSKKETEKKRHDRRKERDRTSSRSNSDAEELDRRTGKETEQKHELDKSYRQEHQRHMSENFKGHNMEKRLGHGAENNTSGNNSRTSTGGRYFDRMKGTFLSSSKALTGGGFFGKKVTTPITFAKENKPTISADHSHSFSHKRDVSPSDFVAGKCVMGLEERSINHPVISEPQLNVEPRKSWYQLFVHSSSVPTNSNANVISRPSTKPRATIQSPQSQFSGEMSSIRTFDNPISFGLPSPFIEPTYSSGSTTTSVGFSPAIEPIFPKVGEDSCDFMPEDLEHFEDPCYVPDPISLLGPVSESLDLRAEFPTEIGLEKKQHALKNVPPSSQVINKPSPIESPLTKLRAADEKHSNGGTWHMWKSPLGLVGGSSNWLLPLETTQSRTMSLFTKEDSLLHSAYNSPQKERIENDQRSGVFSPVTGPNNHDTWSHSQNGYFPALRGRESYFSVRPQEEGAHNDVALGSPPGSASDHPFKLTPANHWLEKVKNGGESSGKSAASGVFPNQDVQSFW